MLLAMISGGGSYIACESRRKPCAGPLPAESEPASGDAPKGTYPPEFWDEMGMGSPANGGAGECEPGMGDEPFTGIWGGKGWEGLYAGGRGGG